MSIPNAEYRNLFLSGDISNETVKGILTSIYFINSDDDQKEKDYKDWVREPIKLFINSFGGSVYDGLALVDAIKQSKTPVHTICLGSCMSMGLWIFESGKKRLIGEHGTLMYHDVATGVFDKVEGLRQELNESERLRKMAIKDITSRSLVKEETLNDYVQRKAEWYIPAEQAIELQLADEYYKGE